MDIKRVLGNENLNIPLKREINNFETESIQSKTSSPKPTSAEVETLAMHSMQHQTKKELSQIPPEEILTKDTDIDSQTILSPSDLAFHPNAQIAPPFSGPLNHTESASAESGLNALLYPSEAPLDTFPSLDLDLGIPDLEATTELWAEFNSISAPPEPTGLLEEILQKQTALNPISQHQVLNLEQADSTVSESARSVVLKDQGSAFAPERLNAQSSLEILGHGSPDGATLSGLNPQQLANKLIQAGITQLAVLDLKSCFSEGFKASLATELEIAGIQVGEIRTYTGQIAISRETGKVLQGEAASQVTGHDGLLGRTPEDLDANYISSFFELKPETVKNIAQEIYQAINKQEVKDFNDITKFIEEYTKQKALKLDSWNIPSLASAFSAHFFPTPTLQESIESSSLDLELNNTNETSLTEIDLLKIPEIKDIKLISEEVIIPNQVDVNSLKKTPLMEKLSNSPLVSDNLNAIIEEARAHIPHAGNKRSEIKFTEGKSLRLCNIQSDLPNQIGIHADSSLMWYRPNNLFRGYTYEQETGKFSDEPQKKLLTSFIEGKTNFQSPITNEYLRDYTARNIQGGVCDDYSAVVLGNLLQCQPDNIEYAGIASWQGDKNEDRHSFNVIKFKNEGLKVVDAWLNKGPQTFEDYGQLMTQTLGGKFDGLRLVVYNPENFDQPKELKVEGLPVVNDKLDSKQEKFAILWEEAQEGRNRIFNVFDNNFKDIDLYKNLTDQDATRYIFEDEEWD